MKIYSYNNWRYIRHFFLWCLFFFALYWYIVKDSKRQHTSKHVMLDRIKMTQIKALNGPDEERNSVLRTDYTQIPSDELIDDQIPPEVITTVIANVNKRLHKADSSEFTQFQENATNDNNNKINDGSKDVRNQQDEDESDEERMTITALGSLIVSTLRGHIANGVVLNPNRLHWTIAFAGAYSDKLYSPPSRELPQQRLPQAIIIGFGKCGTRALINFLSMHPYIVSAGPEMHFFDIDNNFQQGLEWYRQQMPVSYSNQITVEKTPSYITSERARDEIYKLNKRTKLIVLVKDPVSRIVSQSIRSNPDIESMCLLEKNGQLQVNNESRTVQWSMYVNYLKMWKEKFPLSQIHVIETDEFVKFPGREIHKLETFLGVPPMITDENFYFNKTKGFYCKRPFHVKKIICLPEGKGMKHPRLLPEVEKALYDFFRGYNEDLYSLLGRRFHWEPKGLVERRKERK